jgi:hypothetical protein
MMIAFARLPFHDLNPRADVSAYFQPPSVALKPPLG